MPPLLGSKVFTLNWNGAFLGLSCGRTTPPTSETIPCGSRLTRPSGNSSKCGGLIFSDLRNLTCEIGPSHSLGQPLNPVSWHVSEEAARERRIRGRGGIMAVGGPERLCKLRNVPHASYIYGLTPQSLSSKLCPHPFRVKSQQLLMIVSDLTFFKCFRECCNKKGLSFLQDQVH